MYRFAFLVLSIWLLTAKFAVAEVVIVCREDGADVVCVGNGSLNVSTLGLFSTAQSAGGLTQPLYGSLLVGSATGSPSDYYRLPPGVHIGPIGTGGLSAPTMGAANHWGIAGAIEVGRDHIIVPTGYVSGDPLPQSSSRYANESLESLGLTPGNYEVTWGSGADVDRLTIRVVGFALGDVNRDGSVNLLDVAPFIDLVSFGEFQAEADINGDGSVNLLDVDPFIALFGN